MSQREGPSVRRLPFEDELALQRAIGSAVRDTREAAGIRQEELGDLIGVGQDAISRLEQGKRRLSLILLGQIETVLGQPIGFFTRAIGAIEVPTNVREQLAADPQLDQAARMMLTTVYDYAAATSSRHRR
jgi:transcriptional regulator with XRE-family HTH domain